MDLRPAHDSGRAQKGMRRILNGGPLLRCARACALSGRGHRRYWRCSVTPRAGLKIYHISLGTGARADFVIEPEYASEAFDPYRR